MAGDTYVYIDAGHLRRFHLQKCEQWFGSPPPPLDLQAVRGHLAAHKCFYYDCLGDVQRKSETEADFKLRLQQQKDLLAAYQRTTNTQVRLGSLSGEGERVRQKKVDIMLAVDALSHAARGITRTAIIVTGDQDFTPQVEALVGLGLFVHVWGIQKETSSDLADAADVFRPIRFSDLCNWVNADAKNLHPLPERITGGINGEALSTPDELAGGMLAKRYFIGGLYWVAVKTPEALLTGDTNWEMHRHPDEARLKLMCELEYGELSW